MYKRQQYRDRIKRVRVNASLKRGSIEEMISDASAEAALELAVIIKADVHGSKEAIEQSLLKLDVGDNVKIKILHTGVGEINESDVSLASATEAMILGFNVRANNQAKEAAEKFGITILYHSIIYDLIDDVKSLLEGKLDPELRSTVTGTAEVLEVFKNSKIGNIAGCNVLDGKMIKGLHAKLLRDDVVIYDGLLSTLRRFKDDAKEVNAGQECGLSFDNNQDIRPGDKIECYKVDEIKRTI